MRFILAITLCLVASGCGKDDSSEMSRVSGANKPSDPAANTSTPSQFNQDIDRICNGEKLSGAIDMPKGYTRAMTVAKWLAANLRTAEGRRFLGETTALLDPKKKAKHLAAQAKNSGVPSCPLVQIWSGGKKN